MSHNEPRCGTCKYAVATSTGWDSTGWECHRYPPALLSTVQGTTQLRVGWPEVRASAVCGEWAAVPAKPEPTPTPEEPKRGLDAAALGFQGPSVGRAQEREDVVEWLTEAQFHVVTQDEVRLILRLREQFSRGLHERKKA